MLKSRRFMLSVAVVVCWIFSPLASSAASSRDLVFRQATLELGYGAGIENTKLLRLNLQWTFSPHLLSSRGFEVAGIAQLGGGIWRGDRDIVDVSATPIFRLQGVDHSPHIRPFFEAAIGFHYISDTQMRRRVFSTNFQFGDHLGIGLVFGKHKALEIAYLFQHLSNASIKRPNSGINFHVLRIGYSL